MALRLRFESLPASLELLRPPSTSAAFRATSSLIPARTVNRSVPRGIPVPRYSAYTPTPKSRAGFRTRRTPCFPSCVKVLFQTGNAHGVPRSPHPFAPSTPKSFLCAVLLPSFHPKVAFWLACVAMTLVLFNFSKSSKRSSRLHHLGLLIRPHPKHRNTHATQNRANAFI